jgi:hypothetical protein
MARALRTGRLERQWQASMSCQPIMRDRQVRFRLEDDAAGDRYSSLIQESSAELVGRQVSTRCAVAPAAPSRCDRGPRYQPSCSLIY